MTYVPTGNPTHGGPGASATIRAEFQLIANAITAIALPSFPLAPNAAVVVSSSGLALTTTGALSLAGALTTTGPFDTTLIQGATTSLTLPTASGRLITRDSTDTLTNKTYDTAGSGNFLSINGLAATANTGTGAVVRATSATLVTPNIGAATGTSLNLTQATGSAAVLNTTQTATGSVASAYNLNLIDILSDDLDAGASNAATINGLGIAHFYGGAAARGGRQSFAVFSYLNAATSASNANRNYVAITGVGNANTGDGGTDPTVAGNSQGAVFGLAGVAVAASGATALLNTTGCELNSAMQAGSSVFAKTLLQLSGRTDDVVAGSVVNAMVWAYNQGASPPKWTDGILFDDSAGNGALPFDFSSTVLRTNTGTIGTGIDFSGSTVATAAFKSTGFLVDGTGQIVSGSPWLPYTPGITSATGAITTVGATTARYQRVGKGIKISLDFIITTNGTGGESVNVTLPFAANSAGALVGREAIISGKTVLAQILPTDTKMTITFYDNNYPGADSARFIMSGIYETV